MFAVFKDTERFRRGKVLDYSLTYVRQWWPGETWKEFMVRIVGPDGQIDEDELRRYAEATAPKRERKVAA